MHFLSKVLIGATSLFTGAVMSLDVSQDVAQNYDVCSLQQELHQYKVNGELCSLNCDE